MIFPALSFLVLLFVGLLSSVIALTDTQFPHEFLSLLIIMASAICAILLPRLELTHARKQPLTSTTGLIGIGVIILLTLVCIWWWLTTGTALCIGLVLFFSLFGLDERIAFLVALIALVSVIGSLLIGENALAETWATITYLCLVMGVAISLLSPLSRRLPWGKPRLSDTDIYQTLTQEYLINASLIMVGLFLSVILLGGWLYTYDAALLFRWALVISIFWLISGLIHPVHLHEHLRTLARTTTPPGIGIVCSIMIVLLSAIFLTHHLTSLTPQIRMFIIILSSIFWWVMSWLWIHDPRVVALFTGKK